MTVYFAASAEVGLVEIATWIGADDPRRAIGFVLELRAACLGIDHFPRKGRVVRRTGPRSIRRWIYREYIILYETAGDDVFILFVVHGARNIRKVLRLWSVGLS